jgi:hypothetical protein
MSIDREVLEQMLPANLGEHLKTYTMKSIIQQVKIKPKGIVRFLNDP